ncbi:membrane-spanning 4-domains subfamily A member 12-like [Epinephelus lanceolatus]|uniref:uncharacterized protein LOC117265487 n=1 Tax=Epinephelus lanceolatus TaxID=310571 RepID=UPI001445B62A|nr:uncharacterized protein LOC117265487 [Epinephelus lanceolatus]XP_033495892.1 uncharacterized protein LOC117265487 [Epinephelus lanceolatus]
MPVTVVRDNGVTVITVANDRKSTLPLLCQILKTLCFGPSCCSVKKGLMQTSVTAALGTIQIMVGLFNIGLGPGQTFMHPRDLTDLGAAYWLGAVFIITGIMTLVAGRNPSLCLVGFAVLMNIVGSIFALTAIGLYATDLTDASSYNMCFDGNYRYCRYDGPIARNLVTVKDATMIILAVLQLFVCISFAGLAITALTAEMKKEEGGKDVEDQQPQLKEILLTSPGA